MSRRFGGIIVLGVIVATAGLIWLSRDKGHTIIDLSPKSKEANMQLSSPAFDDNKTIPTIYTCKGENISPPLVIAGVPAQAKSLALIMHDPDAPSGDFLHWLIWNIPSQTPNIAENSAPANAVQGKNGSGNNKYAGPCPPSGIHHYKFDLYALDSTVDLPGSASREDVESVMSSHVLARSTLTGLFGQ